MTWTKEDIKALLVATQEAGPLGKVVKTGQVENRKIVYKMLQAMFQRQTADEQCADTTKHVNKMGFNGSDARVLSDIAKKSQQYQNLTIRQAAYVAKKLMKYAGQLEQIAKGNVKPVVQAATPEIVQGTPTVVLCKQCHKAPVCGDSTGYCGGCSDVYWSNEAAKHEAALEAQAYLFEIGLQTNIYRN
jgi:hypothetical protein